MDDVVARYPWGDEEGYTLEGYIERQSPELDAAILTRFNATLQFNALFGRELMINDGYILNNPASRIALLEPDRSPLRALLEGGRVQILQRNLDYDLDETALDMASKNNSSFQKLSSLPDWSAFRQELRNVSRIAGVKKRWPKSDISEGLHRFLLSLAEPQAGSNLEKLDPRDIERLIKGYKDTREREQTAPRDAWERTARELFGSDADKPKLFEAMQIANVFYHLNFALCLAAESPSGTAVETISTSYIDGMLDRGNELLTPEAAAEIEQSLRSLSGSFYFPGPEEALDGAKLCELYSGVRGSTGEAKLNFLQAIENSRSADFCSQDLRDAANDYSEALQDLFNPRRTSNKLNMTVDGFIRRGAGKAAEVGAKSYIGNLLRDASAVDAGAAGIAAATTSICIDFGKRIAIATLPYITPPPVGTDSQFLKNIKNRNRVFGNLFTSTPVSRAVANAHTKTLTKFE